MATKTITLTGAEIAVTGLDGAHAHIRNDGADVIYAAKTAGITAGADGVLSIPAGQAATVYGISGTVYMMGTGSAQIISNDYSELPFKTSTASGGSAVDEQARTALGAHVGNAEIHVTADEKANWDGKAGGVGQNTTGTEYIISNITYTAGDGAEIFNGYVNNKAIGKYSHAEGRNTTTIGDYSHAEGIYTKASSSYSHAEGYLTIVSGDYSHAEGYYTTASNYASHAGGKYNKAMTNSSGSSDNTGDAFVIGNGTSKTALSNAFRVTYGGAVYGLSAFNSSGADYAEFIKPWADGNPDNEDRVGYMVTIKDGLLCKANEGDYIVGITSGNPSIVGNADEDYYWRYERDEFNRFVYEDAEEEVEQLDDDGAPVLDENGMPVMVKTGNIIKNAHYKLAADYDPTKQNDYIERKNRPEWSYVGMIGVIPVRDDGTCEVGGYCKCGENGIATRAETRGFDTFFVLERISDNVVSIELR